MRRPEICWKKNRRNFWGPVPLGRLHLFFYGFCPSAELHYTNCVPDFCWKKNRRNFWRPLPLDRLHFFFRTMLFLFFGGTPLHKLCTWHLLIFFRRNSTSQNVRLSSADLYGFSAEVHKFSNRASLQHFLSLACYWPSCNGCNGRGLEWAWISGHWIQSMPRLINGL